MRDRLSAAWRLLRSALIAFAAVAILALGWIGWRGSVAAFEPDRLPLVTDAALGGRILIVSPHPDDETLACGGLIHEALAQGREVRVVMMTEGDGFRRIVSGFRGHAGTERNAWLAMGDARSAEARDALGELGLPASRITFLGYPDGSLRDLFEHDWDTEATGTNGAQAVPYSFARSPGAPYTGASVASDLAGVIAETSPTAVLFPDAEDSNDDHRAANAFVTLALDHAGYHGARFTYLVHRGHFPFPWSYVPEGRIAPPASLLTMGGTWCTFRLARDTVPLKERAVDRYRSQRAAMEPFLDAFVRRNELFAVYRAPAAGPSALATSALDAARMPGVVVRDPSRDTVARFLNPSADVREVSLVRGFGRFWLGLRTQDSIASGVTYQLGMVVLRRDGSLGRLTFDVLGHRVAVTGGDAVSRARTRAPAVHLRRDRLWIALPGDTLRDASECLLTAETRAGTTVFDRTAWRPVMLP